MDAPAAPERPRALALRAAAAAAWNDLDPQPREQLLTELEPHLAAASRQLSARVEALDALSADLFERYRQLTAQLRTRERSQLAHLDENEIAQRTVRHALARARSQHGLATDEQHDKDAALLAELGDEQWASAVEQERLERLRRLSALRYGSPVEEVELAIRRRLGVTLPSAGSDGIEELAA